MSPTENYQPGLVPEAISDSHFRDGHRRPTLNQRLVFLHGLARAAFYDRVRGPEYTDQTGRYVTDVITSEDDIESADRLVHSEYVRRGQLDPNSTAEESLPEGGIIFATRDVKNDKIVASARFILPDPKVGFSSLEYPFQQLPSASEKLIFSKDPGAVAEFRCLAKQPGANQLAAAKLIRAMYKYSRQNGIDYWLAAFDPGPFDSMTKRFSDLGTLTLLSSSIRYPGNLTPKKPVFMCINPEKVETTYMKSTEMTTREKMLAKITTSFVKDSVR